LGSSSPAPPRWLPSPVFRVRVRIRVIGLRPGLGLGLAVRVRVLRVRGQRSEARLPSPAVCRSVWTPPLPSPPCPSRACRWADAQRSTGSAGANCSNGARRQSHPPPRSRDARCVPSAASAASAASLPEQRRSAASDSRRRCCHFAWRRRHAPPHAYSHVLAEAPPTFASPLRLTTRCAASEGH